ncbi:UPF0175 family protein [uncultured Thiodictyon sp.]|jgi:predicted HTH domain antitoxin|uniref:UPF0175 family protein n=1 Tax=uncultured Thiodictyon sp. TaxID=1846217 RepID=UPI0025EC68ED|nr:UPF0175 family protein [uncultured Thiodictyon sp.]
MINLSVPIPEGAFSALRLDPPGLAREMRLAAAIQWYAQGRISQDKAAEIAGLTRAAFIDALSQARVSPFQFSAESLREDLADVD